MYFVRLFTFKKNNHKGGNSTLPVEIDNTDDA